MKLKHPIYECHVNIRNPEHILPLYGQQLGRIRQGAIQEKCDADTIYAAMKRVEKAIIFSPRYADSIGSTGSDQTTADAVAKYRDKFVGFAYFDPREPDAMEKLRHSIEGLGLKGVKYGPIYNAVPLDDPRMHPLYKYCVANDLPLTLHMGTTYARNAPLELGRPIHAEPIALKYPDLKMILAHMGHPWYEECIAVIRKQPNLYAEVSALHYRPWQYYNILVNTQEYKVADKIFFGTDYPATTIDESVDGLVSINDMLEGTKLPRISQETIDLILYSNPFKHWWHAPKQHFG